MPAFRVSGSTGPAPVTSFFGAIPDALTLLSPFQENNSNDPCVLTTDYHAVPLVSQWTPFNTAFLGGANAVTCSFGATTTAPDGTSNAVHLTEAATNSNHYVTAGHNGGAVSGQRLQVFAKAAERTRVGLSLYSPASTTGVKCIFDLAGGQIGVANAVFGSGAFLPYSAGPASIIPFPNGWYLCSMEWNPGQSPGGHNPGGAVLAQIWIDSGSGTGAESTNYAGNGTSGIYVWRATSLPKQMWSFGHNTTFFDDFNSISTIDIGRTNQPGFNWYMSDTWPGPYFPGQYSNSRAVSIAGSNLLLTGVAPTGGETNGFGAILGVHTDNTPTQYPGGYVAGPNNVWQAPIWITARMATYNASITSDTELGIFFVTLEAFTNLAKSQGGAFPIPDGNHLGEFDIVQVNGTDDGDPGFMYMLAYGAGGHTSTGTTITADAAITGVGYPPWLSTRLYHNNIRVIYNGVNYQAINPTNGAGIIGQQPDISPTWWTTTLSPALLNWINYPIPVHDRSQMHVLDYIWIPSFMAGGSNSGATLVYAFEDGNYVQPIQGTSGTYFSSLADSNHAGQALAGALEGGHWATWILGTSVVGVVGDTIDYFRLRK